MQKLAKWSTIALLPVALIALLVRSITFHPPALQNEAVVNQPNAPILQRGQNVKVLSWNLQYMAGKNYEFWYDRADNSGPDIRPTATDITQTFAAVSDLITQHNPDIILLQELHDNAKRTDYEDQLQRLLTVLPQSYANHSETFYWKADFVPLPQIMGSVGMKLAVISKYQLGYAIRHQLATTKTDPITDAFNFRHAIQEVVMPVAEGSSITIMNTHFKAFSQNFDTIQKQVTYLEKLLHDKNAAGETWLIGGDFNLLPPGQYFTLPDEHRSHYQPISAFERIYEQFNVIPSLQHLAQSDGKDWFTHFPNHYKATAPDRTIDYFIYSDDIPVDQAQVLQKNTWHISDHLPMLITFQVP